MSMSKKYINYCILIVLSILIFKINVFADEYILENPCNDPRIIQVLHFAGYLLLIAKISVPLLIIGFGTSDLFKAVIDKDEKSFSKQLKIFGIRVVSGVVVFFIPTIIYAIFNLSSEIYPTINSVRYQKCSDCLLKPTKNTCN